MRAAAPLPFVAFCFKYSVFFLQMCGIKKDNLGYLSRRLGAIYLALIAIPYEPRQKSAMIKMGMSQENSIEGLGVK
jgi:hypothetical protein